MARIETVIERLREQDRALTEAGMPRDTDERIQRRLFAPARPSRARPVLLGLGLAAAAAAAVWILAPAGLLREPTPAPVFTVVSGCLDPSDAGRGSLNPGDEACIVEASPAGVRIATRNRARVTREGNGVRVRVGRVRVEVAKRPRRGPVELYVSHGTIRVLGTTFTVDQHETGGSVTLHVGAIEFVTPDNDKIELSPNETLTWPVPDDDAEPFALADEEEAVPEDRDDDARAALERRPVRAGAQPFPRRPTAQQLSTLLDQVEALRAQGRYRRAVAKLRHAMKSVVDPVAAERLSFEMGSLLTYQLGSSPAGCRHWNRHLRRFGSGRYEDGIERATRRLGCARKQAKP